MGTSKSNRKTIAETQTQILSELDPRTIKHMSRDQLSELQKRLGYGDQWRVWEVPKEWTPPSHASMGQRRVRLTDDRPEADVAWTEILRFALVRSLVPGQRYGVPKPITVRNEVRTAVQVASTMIDLGPERTKWWGLTSEDELVRRKGVRGRTLFLSLGYLHRQGYIWDCPASLPLDGKYERNRKNEPSPKNLRESSNQWLPLPDEFTGQCGQRALWILTTLGPTLLDLFDAVLQLDREILSSDSFGKSLSRRNEKIVELIREWTWSDPNGTAIASVPFSLHMKRKVRPSIAAKDAQLPAYEDFTWPPRTLGEVTQLVSTLQSCHLWLLLLASGPRASTVLGYDTNCLVRSSDGLRLEAKLYKTAEQRTGRNRDWPAPPIVVKTIEQQVRLAELVKSSNRASPEAVGNHLWVQTHRTHQNKGGVGAPMKHINDPLEALVRVFGLRHLLDSANPRVHSHRFRKTLARIVALTLTNAQMILMDCFGHDDPEMTLRRYILSDPAIVADVERVQRELVILMAKEAIESADDLGGAMGQGVRDARAKYLRVHRKSSLDPQDVYELAEALTMQGRDWVAVMPGVICTLPVGFTGPCAAHQGGRNPANCQPGCSNQLLLAYNKSECDDMVRYIVEQLQKAIDEEAQQMVALWAGQLNNWLYRWNSVFEAWVDHPLVAAYGKAQPGCSSDE